MSSEFANKTEMQNLLFAEFSRIFGQEVLLYDKSLLFKKACNQSAALCWPATTQAFNFPKLNSTKPAVSARRNPHRQARGISLGRSVLRRLRARAA